MKLSDELDKPKYDGIMNAIDENTSDYPIRKTKTHKGFRDRNIEDYIGTFETVGNLVKEKVITESMAYDELGYEIEKAWCNKDVHSYINDERKSDKRLGGPNAFYIGFEELAKTYLEKDNKTCKTLDQEATE